MTSAEMSSGSNKTENESITTLIIDKSFKSSKNAKTFSRSIFLNLCLLSQFYIIVIIIMYALGNCDGFSHYLGILLCLTKSKIDRLMDCENNC